MKMTASLLTPSPKHIKNEMQNTEYPFNNSVAQKEYQHPNGNKNNVNMLHL